MYSDNDNISSSDEIERGEEYFIPAAITDTGCERDLNEDRYAVVDSASGVGWFVCDGMGGASGGELAAQLAIDAVRRDLDMLPERSPAVAIESAYAEANRVIVLRRQNQAFSGMGTTIVGAMFKDDEVAIGHIGDSRAYLIRDNSIRQLTHDHTLVQEWVDRGEIPSEEALSHPQAHVLTKCMGAEAVLDVELSHYWIWPVQDGEMYDLLLLCSDGLYSLVSEEELATIVYKYPPQDACVQLVELAKERGGFDNITLAIIPFAGQLREQPFVRSYAVAKRKDPKWVQLLRHFGSDLLKTVMLTGILSALSILAVFFMVVYSMGW